MAIQATCPHCQASYVLRDELGGKTVRCMTCKKPFDVAGTPAPPAPVTRLAPQAPRTPPPVRGKTTGMERVVKARLVEDDEVPTASQAVVQPARVVPPPPPVRRPARQDDAYDDEMEDVLPAPRKPSSLPLILVAAGGGALVLMVLCGGGLWIFMNQVGNPDDTVVVGPGGAEVKAPTSVAEALAALKSGDAPHRSAALAWLTQAPVEDQQRAEVVRALQDIPATDPGAAPAAARALGHWATRDDLPVLVGLLQNSNPEVRGAAISALGRLRDDRAAAPLAERLPDFFDRAAARQALEAIGPAASREVMKYAFNKDKGCRDEALRLLRAWRPDEGELLTQALAALRSTDGDARLGAAQWLAQATVDPKRSAEVTAALEPVLTDSNLFAREPAGTALCLWATADSIPAVIKCLDNQSPEVKRRAADALANLKDPRGAAALARRLPKLAETSQVGRALEAMGPAVAEKEVVKYYFDSNIIAQQEARRILKAFGTKPGVIAEQAAEELRDDGGDANRQADVCEWLGKVKEADQAPKADVSRALNGPLKSTNEHLVETATKAAIVWGTKENVELLAALLPKQDATLNQIRANALQALARIKDPRAAPIMALCLRSQFDHEKAADALVEMGPGAEKAVRPFVKKSEPPVTRVLACRVLLRIGSKDSLPDLQNATRDPVADVRAWAKEAIKAIKERDK
jgi:predicted Zn finger-like uncharacterized protein